MPMFAQVSDVANGPRVSLYSTYDISKRHSFTVLTMYKRAIGNIKIIKGLHSIC